MSSPKGEAAPDRSNANSLTGSLPSGTMRARLGMTGRLSAAAAVRAASSSDSTCLGADAMLAPPVRCRGRDPVCHRPEAAGPLASAGSVFGDDHRPCPSGARAARRRTGRAGAAASGSGGTGTGRPGGARGPGPGAGLGGPGTRSAGPVHAGDPRCGAAGPGRGRHERRGDPRAGRRRPAHPGSRRGTRRDRAAARAASDLRAGGRAAGGTRRGRGRLAVPRWPRSTGEPPGPRRGRPVRGPGRPAPHRARGPATAVLVEVAAAAGLLGETDGEYGGEPAFLPTPGYDAWRGQSIANRWVMLARAWLTMPRQPGLVGRRDERDRPLGALAPELERVGAPALRAAALAALSDGKPGLAPDTEQVLEVLAWRSPRRYGAAGEQVRADAVRS